MTAVLTNSNYIKLGESDTGDEISKSVRYINYMLTVVPTFRSVYSRKTGTFGNLGP